MPVEISKPTSLAAAVASKQASIAIPVPAGLHVYNSDELGQQWFHACIYGETDARKTVTAATFAPPAQTLIILTRRKEQAKPLEGLGYTVVQVETAEALNYALSFPEKISPAWADQAEPVLILDDATEGVSKLLDAAATEVGEAFGRHHKEAGALLREHARSIMRRPLHFIMTAIAKPTVNPITKEERISPDLPTAMLSMITTELEYCFYIKKSTWQLLTSTDFMQYTEYDQDQKKDVTFRREIFAKNKLPLNLALAVPPVLAKNEKMDLRAIWNKIKEAKGASK